jgi:hypothetical protein
MKKLICLLLPLTLTNVVHAASSEAAFQQCAVDMCGPAEKLEYTKSLGIMQVPSQQNKDFLKNVLFPRLEKFMDSSLAIQITQANSFDTFIARSDKEPLNQDQQTIMKLVAVLKKAGPALNKSFDPKSTAAKLIIDPELLAKALPEMDATLAGKWAKLINTYLGHPNYATLNNMASFTYPILLQSIQKQSPLPPAWAVPNYFNQLKNQINSYTLRIGTALTSGLDLTVLEKSAAMEKLSDSEEKMVISILRSYFTFDMLLSKEAIEAAKDIPMTLDEAAKMVDLEKDVAETKKLISSVTSIQAEKEKAFSACTISLTKFLAAAPSDLQQRKSLELLTRVKTAAKVAASQYLTGDALFKAMLTIEKTQFTKPLTSAAAEKMILERIERVLRQGSEYANFIQKAKTGEGEWQSLALLTIMSGISGENGLFGTLIESCKDLEPKGIVDASYSSVDMITMSWQSAMFPEFGASVMAHELGHAISGAVGKLSSGIEAYSDTRACTTSKHQDLLSAEKRNELVVRYQEEDWADEFAATTINELNKIWPYSKNFACLLIGTKDKQYDGLILQTVENPDTHSTSFLRGLVAQSKMGSLPASCMKALSQAEAQTIQRRCGK